MSPDKVDKPRYPQLLSCLPVELANDIKAALTAQPYRIDLDERAPLVNVAARVGKKLYQKERESHISLPD